MAYNQIQEQRGQLKVMRDGLVERGYDMNRFLDTRLFGLLWPNVKKAVIEFVKTKGKSLDHGEIARLVYINLPKSH